MSMEQKHDGRITYLKGRIAALEEVLDVHGWPAKDDPENPDAAHYRLVSWLQIAKEMAQIEAEMLRHARPPKGWQG